VKLFSCQLFVVPGLFRCCVKFLQQKMLCAGGERGQICCAEVLQRLCAEAKIKIQLPVLDGKNFPFL